MMCLSAVASGCCVAPSIIGTFGPYTSASSKPTLLPSFAKASARFTATVVLPTPPLPLATATRFFTPGIGWRSGCCIGAGPGGICFLLVGQAFLPVLASINRNRFSLTASAKATDENVCPTQAPWHFLYFFPDPQGQGSLRPTFAPARTGFGASACAGPVWYCKSFCWRCWRRSISRATEGNCCGSLARAAALATAAAALCGGVRGGSC